MKMLMFDFRDSEKNYFNKNILPDFDIEFIKEPLNEFSNLTDDQIEHSVAISVFISSHVTENVIRKFKNLRMIATRSTGFNHIDLDYCRKNNIAVFNVGDYGSTAVAQFTFMLIMALNRKLIPAYLDIQRNMVNYQCYEGKNLSNLSIGILGCGAIGCSVAKIAHFFGMKIYICSYEKNPEVTPYAEYVSLEEMLSKSDIITLHLPYNKDTYHIINEDSFNKMKDGVFIINTARGEILDIKALYNNIVSGKIKGAALDVLECEKIAVNERPLNIDESNSHCLTKALIVQKLLGMDNIIITPHIAYNTEESIEIILDTTFNNLRDYCKGLHTNQLR